MAPEARAGNARCEKQSVDNGRAAIQVCHAECHQPPHTMLCRVMCEVVHMATNLAIDPELLNHALQVSGVRTKKEAVTIALQEFIARREQRALLDVFGTLEWDESYDHKADRGARDRRQQDANG